MVVAHDGDIRGTKVKGYVVNAMTAWRNYCSFLAIHSSIKTGLYTLMFLTTLPPRLTSQQPIQWDMTPVDTRLVVGLCGQWPHCYWPYYLRPGFNVPYHILLNCFRTRQGQRLLNLHRRGLPTEPSVNSANWAVCELGQQQIVSHIIFSQHLKSLHMVQSTDYSNQSKHEIIIILTVVITDNLATREQLPEQVRWQETRREECGWVLARPAPASAQARRSQTYLQQQSINDQCTKCHYKTGFK